MKYLRWSTRKVYTKKHLAEHGTYSNSPEKIQTLPQFNILKLQGSTENQF